MAEQPGLRRLNPASSSLLNTTQPSTAQPCARRLHTPAPPLDSDLCAAPLPFAPSRAVAQPDADTQRRRTCTNKAEQHERERARVRTRAAHLARCCSLRDALLMLLLLCAPLAAVISWSSSYATAASLRCTLRSLSPRSVRAALHTFPRSLRCSSARVLRPALRVFLLTRRSLASCTYLHACLCVRYVTQRECPLLLRPLPSAPLLLLLLRMCRWLAPLLLWTSE